MKKEFYKIAIVLLCIDIVLNLISIGLKIAQLMGRA